MAIAPSPPLDWFYWGTGPCAVNTPQREVFVDYALAVPQDYTGVLICQDNTVVGLVKV